MQDILHNSMNTLVFHYVTLRYVALQHSLATFTPETVQYIYSTLDGGRLVGRSIGQYDIVILASTLKLNKKTINGYLQFRMRFGNMQTDRKVTTNTNGYEAVWTKLTGYESMANGLSDSLIDDSSIACNDKYNTI